ncbi:hypothetical protein [Rhodopseudomonas sp. P2A-2r]|nr:hypothetical protein [Rhodopseudomonas sp. P2A-2r]UZE51541.1 hypothetical protein ONR75_13625 [Rhodopseudomonas sp. P2A-2r]
MKPDEPDELAKALSKGLADADAGRTQPLDEAFRILRAELGLAEKSGG